MQNNSKDVIIVTKNNNNKTQTPSWFCEFRQANQKKKKKLVFQKITKKQFENTLLPKYKNY